MPETGTVFRIVTSKAKPYGPWSEIRSFKVIAGTAIETVSSVPTEFALHQNYPNPFDPSTTIRYDLPLAADVRLTVFDVRGRLVESLVNGQQSAGRHVVTWEADRIPSGVYFVRIEAADFQSSLHVLLLR